MFIDKEKLKKAAEGFSVELTGEMLSRFDIYASFLAEYNKNVNLTAITDPEGIAVKHFEDSLAILKYVTVEDGCRACDVGAGAGFPSIPLLIARPNINMTVIEATNKKLVFIKLLLEKLGLKAELLHTRGEAAGKEPSIRESFDIVTARAVAELRMLSEFCIPLVRVGGVFVSMKSSLADDEVSAASNAIPALGGKIQSRADYKLSNGDPRTLITVKKISHTPTKYPRAGTLIAKKPL